MSEKTSDVQCSMKEKNEVVENESKAEKEASLKNDELQYRHLYDLQRLMADNVPDLIWAKDMDGRYIFVNQAMCDKLIKCECPDEAIGKTDLYFAERERDAGFTHTFGELCIDSDGIIKKKRAAGRFLEDGMVRNEYLILDVHKAPFFDKEGRLIGTVGCGRDVTQEKKVEKALRESEEKYRLLFENMVQGVFYQSAEGHLIDVNQSALDIFGLSREEFLSRTSTNSNWQVIQEDGTPIPGHKHPSMVALQTGSAVKDTVVGVFNPVKSDYVWVNVNAIPQFHRGSPTPYQVFVTLYDITGQKKASEAIRHSEEKYRCMMGAMKDPIYITSDDFRIEYMNPRMISKIGRNAVGEICYEVFHGRTEPCDWCVVDKVLRGEHIDYEHLNPKDNRTYSVSNSPVYFDGVKLSKLTIYRDITEIKAMEAQLRQSRKMESIGTLAGGIAHDFNNLLYIVLGNAELALEDTPKWNPVNAHLEEIRSACMRAGRIVKQLLHFSRKTDQPLQSMDIVSVINNTLQFLRSSLPSSIRIEKDIPDKEIPILGDADQIEQAIVNIFTNAFQAMEETGGTIGIKVGTITLENHPDLKNGDYLQIHITDTGPGIDPEIIERIFDPYFTTREIGKGSGMGLSTVLGIIKGHGGSVSVASEIGKGTAFMLLIPLIGKPLPSTCGTSDSVLTGKETVLLVDDEKPIAEMIRTMLSRLGYEVETETDPLAAIARFESDPHRFDLVLTDMTMPELSGVGLFRKLQEIRRDIPVILCSGHSALIDPIKADAMGIAAYIRKPIVREELAKSIRKVLNRKAT